MRAFCVLAISAKGWFIRVARVDDVHFQILLSTESTAAQVKWKVCSDNAGLPGVCINISEIVI